MHMVDHPRVHSCASCGAAAELVFLAQDTNRLISTTSFPYYRCAACGWWFLHPPPADLGAYYPTGYHPIPADAADLAERAELDRYKIDLVLAQRSGGRLLEVGPSYGMFLHLAREAGFDCAGIEMDSGCCAFLRTLGFTVRQSDDVVGSLAASEPSDVVAAWHVIEHLPDPWSALTAMVANLKPGGLLVLAQPNPGALQFRLLGRYWTHLDAPRHLCLIPPALLESRLRRLGCTPVQITATDRGSLGWNRFGWVHSLRNLARSRLLRFALHVSARLIELAVMLLERSGMRGSAYTAIFRKDAS